MADFAAGFGVSGCIASRISSTPAIANTETVVVSAPLLANTLSPGTVLRIQAWGVMTNTTTASTSTYRVRIGPTTLTGSIVASQAAPNVATARTNMPVAVMAMVTVQSVGSSGTAIGVAFPVGGSASGVPGAGLTAAATVNTTVQNLVELTFVSGAASTSATFHSATIEVVKG